VVVRGTKMVRSPWPRLTTVVRVLSRGQLEEFAERGFLLLPQVVPRDVVAAAGRAIDGLTGTGTLEVPAQVQVALNIPPNPHRPGMHHLDGFPPGPDGRPGTFIMLAGVLMSDQRRHDAGNLWVWPGTHLTHAEYFRKYGPDAFLAAGGYPPIRLPEPEQVTGEAGDLLLAHHQLGHNIGANTSPAVRRAVYFRIKRAGHDPRWREFLTDPWLDYDTVRDVQVRRNDPAGLSRGAETETGRAADRAIRVAGQTDREYAPG
jgi:Phytanoyl-CoA dioxygenase (PhyH)